MTDVKEAGAYIKHANFLTRVNEDRELPKSQPIVFISLGIETHDHEFLREVKAAWRDPVIPVISRLYKSVSQEPSLHLDGSPQSAKMSLSSASMHLGLLLLLSLVHGALALKLCSFNVKSFGESKKENHNAMDVIVKIIKRCDLILLMEIKDSDNSICPMLMEKLNGNARRSTTYNYVISSRLGRNTYKEQYAFLYKEKLVSVKANFVYHDYQDGDTDVFSREPFVVWFQAPFTAVKDFVIVPLHAAPGSSVKEMDELVDVYMDVKRQWKVENFIFMGDFNADCSYVPKKAWKNIRLRMDSHFVWLIGDQEDTTVRKSTHCAYDRIVLRGQEVVNSVVPRSNGTFDFQKAYGLSEEEALDVSDHFPVEFKLQSSRALTNNRKSVALKKRRKGSRS